MLAEAQLERIRFGSVPDDSEPMTRAALDTLCRFLSNSVEVPVDPVVFPSPAALAEAFGAGEVHLAWSSPTLVLTASELSDAIPLVSSVRDGMTLYHGVLFCKTESPLRSIVDLAGCHIAWVAPTSAAGYIFPRLALASHGIDPRELFSIESFHDSHGNVARTVLHGEADAGATYAVFEGGDPTSPLIRAGFLDVVQDETARILFATPAIPSDLIIASPKTTNFQRALLIGAFVEAVRDPAAAAAVRAVLGADGFEPYEPSAFTPLRHQVEDGRLLGLIDL